MRTVIFEHGIKGHYLAYMPPLIEAVAELCDEVVLICQRAAVGTLEYAQYVEPFESRIDIQPTLPPAPRGAIRNALARLRMLKRSLKEEQFDQFYLPRADGVTQLVGPLQSVGLGGKYRKPPIEGLVMQSRFVYEARQGGLSLRSKAARLAMEHAPWQTLHHLDPLAYDYLLQRGAPVANRLAMMPDPVPEPLGVSPNEARERLGLPVGGRYIGCVGTIDQRKGCDRLVDSFVKADLRADDRLLLAGVCQPEVQQVIDREAGRLVRTGRVQQINRFLSDEELALAVEAMDVVSTPYPDHVAPASIVTRAAAAGKPVLGSDFGWIGWVVPKFGLGAVCPVDDADALAGHIRTSLDEADGHQPGEAARRFVAFNTLANYRACWTRGLRARLGLGHDPEHVDWSWVLEATR